jgi:uncharacterized Zn-binding protein involved in type VI secretion
MPGFLVQVGTQIMCPHGGMVQIIPTNTQVLVGGLPVALVTDTCVVAGCVFSTPAGPAPCVTAKFTTGTTRVLINGQPALVPTSTGLCTGGPAPVPATIAAPQPRVKGI